MLQPDATLQGPWSAGAHAAFGLDVVVSTTFQKQPHAVQVAVERGGEQRRQASLRPQSSESSAPRQMLSDGLSCEHARRCGRPCRRRVPAAGAWPPRGHSSRQSAAVSSQPAHQITSCSAAVSVLHCSSGRGSIVLGPRGCARCFSRPCRRRAAAAASDDLGKAMPCGEVERRRKNLRAAAYEGGNAFISTVSARKRASRTPNKLCSRCALWFWRLCQRHVPAAGA